MKSNNILTVDVEDWFHICGIENMVGQDRLSQLESRVEHNTLKIIDKLKQKETLATFFVLGCVAERHPALVKEIQKHGHEIATHGYGHQRVYTMTPEAFRKDLKRSVNVISQITGSDIIGYRAPEWSIRDDSLWALDILKQEGFVYDSSMAPLPIIGNPGYTRIPHVLSLNRGRLWEIPPLVAFTPLVNLPLGGGWGLRTFPYRLIRSSIRKLNRRAQPALIYLHPREFDSENPHIQLPLVTKFVLHAAVERTERRLDRLLDDFTFSTVSDILEQLSQN
jgi:peptidoglycan-N-acetylglucosamine deacetylase